MAVFNSQADEGYSEDPLNALGTPSSFQAKTRQNAMSGLGSGQMGADMQAWMIQHISGLSIDRKTELAMALLSDLPTTVVSQIVEQLKPRLYIDFVRYLPPEICLKILGFLDPVSLIHVARSCRAWYDLALDRKLWEQLYYMEGWKAKPDEIAAWQEIVNKSSSSQGVSRRVDSEADGHAHKKRAVAVSPTLDADMDMMMVDADSSIKQEPTEMGAGERSLFGGPRYTPVQPGPSQRIVDVDMHSAGSGSSSKGKGIDRGKGADTFSVLDGSSRPKDNFLQTVLASPPSRLPKSSLWELDGPSKRYKMNWKHAYTMRRRLESNWELGKYTNFQFPHPNHPEEGHGECIYSLQFNPQYLVSGSRDQTLKVWNMETRRCIRTLAKHRGSVLCLQFDSDPKEDIIVSGSSDSDVIIWQFSTGKEIQTLKHAHRESVLNVKFDERILVTCSKDKTIKIFNRKPLRPGDLGYREVDPVGAKVNYGYSLTISPEDLPSTPAWTMIGVLEGHSAAVNAVQIHGREVVSASGDRHIKLWDWPKQTCDRTIVGHTKGIACVQYDGRRIVSGSSDDEVKVFDRQTGLEVASLRAHDSLVRTVQAGFGDLPYSAEEDAAEAKRIDQEYFRAVEAGLIDERDRPRPGRRQGNAGSRRPEDICAYGATLPPGGGGGKYGRIVSGSYDTSIIIWRRDKEGVWKDQHHLKQEEAAVAAVRQGRAGGLAASALATDGHAGIPLHPSVRGAVSRQADPAAAPADAALSGSGSSSRTASAPPGTSNRPTLPPISALTTQLNRGEGADSSSTLTPATYQLRRVIDEAIQNGQQAFQRAISAHPGILSQRAYVEGMIDTQQNAVARSQLRQAFSGALIRAQFEQARLRREALRNSEPPEVAASSASQAVSQNRSTESAAITAGQPGSHLTPAQLAAAHAHQAHAQLRNGSHGHLHQVLSSSASSPAPIPAPASLPSIAPIQAPAQHHQPHHHHHHSHHPHITHAPLEGHDAANPARVFKLQFDARRIICCSQTSVIVGWDFCNGDPELEEASRFFGHVE
ncbi:putative WD-40 repeat-containing protein [Cladorrhinum sp. PSN332]|nr:putative WD-40 repeat-containing protein [Cladorrhinum sp. PSN332]